MPQPTFAPSRICFYPNSFENLNRHHPLPRHLAPPRPQNPQWDLSDGDQSWTDEEIDAVVFVVILFQLIVRVLHVLDFYLQQEDLNLKFRDPQSNRKYQL